MRRILPRFALLLSIALLATSACHAPAPSPTARAEAPSAPWWRGKVFYEIFVRSFADSDGDGIGDLRGIRQKLDYLNDGKPGGDDLGVDALWLMPIYPSPSYHGYDVTDYEAVNPQYGTLKDLDALVTDAHARGVRVILDYVLNHTSIEHPWFESARQGPDARFRDYYVWRTTPLAWGRPWDKGPVWHEANGAYYYGLFVPAMPDLNLGNPEVEAEMLGAMRFWLARGIDGFRVDAARHLFESEDGVLVDQPETFALVARMRAALAKDYPNALLVAEAWADHKEVAPYDDGRGFQMAFDFELSSAIQVALASGTTGAIAQAIASRARLFRDADFLAPFLTNHDMARVMRSLGGDVAKAKIAAALLFAMPGSPFVYYGEEIGMQGGPDKRDEDKRTPMRWSAAASQHGFTDAAASWYGETSETTGIDVASELTEDASLLRLYERLIALRHAHAVLETGETQLIVPENGADAVVRLLRRDETGRAVLLLANVSAMASEPITIPVAGMPSTLLAGGFDGAGCTGGTALHCPALAPYGFAYVGLDR